MRSFFKALAILPHAAVGVGFERSVVQCLVPDLATVALIRPECLRPNLAPFSVGDSRPHLISIDRAPRYSEEVPL